MQHMNDIFNIEGTYILVKYEAFDGKTATPPIQEGSITFTKDRRIFTFVGKDDQGRYSSEMYVARYRLTDTTYSETPEYLVLDYGNPDKPATYDLGSNTVSSPVKIINNKISFALPHEFETTWPVVVEFDGGMMKATVGNKFIYYWQKTE
jgi:hypothetical protein